MASTSKRWAPLCQSLTQNSDTTVFEQLPDTIISGFTDVIFGSNAIEVLGGAIGITGRYCRQVFDGYIPDVEDIGEKSDEYSRELFLQAVGPQTYNLYYAQGTRLSSMP